MNTTPRRSRWDSIFDPNLHLHCIASLAHTENRLCLGSQSWPKSGGVFFLGGGYESPDWWEGTYTPSSPPVRRLWRSAGSSPAGSGTEPRRPDNLVTFGAYTQCFLAYEIEFSGSNTILHGGIAGLPPPLAAIHCVTCNLSSK